MGASSTILALDDGENTEVLVRTALVWVGWLGKKVRIARIIDETVLRDTTRAMGVVGGVARKVRETFLEEGREALRDLLVRLQAPPVVEIETTAGNTMESAKAILDRNPYALLLLTPRLRSALGSIAAEIVGYARGNCLVFSPEAPVVEVRRILVATMGAAEDRYAFSAALELAKLFGARMRVLLVVLSNEELQIYGQKLLEQRHLEARSTLQCIAEEAGKGRVPMEGAVKEGGGAEAIVADAKVWKPDLVVVGSFNRTGFHRILMGSIAGTLINKVTVPVFVAKTSIVVSGEKP